MEVSRKKKKFNSNSNFIKAEVLICCIDIDNKYMRCYFESDLTNQNHS